MDLLFALRDLDVPESLPDAIDRRARGSLQREIERDSRRARRWRLIGGRTRRAILMPVALLLISTTAAAATGLVRPVVVLNWFGIARDNATDAPLRLFERNPAAAGTAPARRWHETVIAPTVREIATFTVAGVGRIQYWVADTYQHGICTALRLPDGTWAGMQNNGRVGGMLPGCRPTRAQTAAGALVLDGFDYQYDDVVGHGDQQWVIRYGVVSAVRAPVAVTDTHNGTRTQVIDQRYFAIANRSPSSFGHLKALDAAGRPVAVEGRPLSRVDQAKSSRRMQ